MSEQLWRVVLDGPESYEALENAQRHGCQLQLCSVGHEERWQDFPNDIQNDLRAFPPTRYRAVAICAPGGAPGEWEATARTLEVAARELQGMASDAEVSGDEDTAQGLFLAARHLTADAARRRQVARHAAWRAGEQP